jgi:hypothetical protein
MEVTMTATTQTATFRSSSIPNPFLVLAEARTYTTLLYLLLGFPLGLVYFVMLVTGGALGIGLSVIAVGLVILFMLVLAGWALTLFERQLAIHLLGANVPPAKPEGAPKDGWPWIKSVFGNPVTWKGILFLGLKFPLGLASWVVTIVLLAIVATFVTAPLSLALGASINIFEWQIETYGEAAVLTLIGFLALLPTAYFLNALGAVWARFAEVMLGREWPESTPLPVEAVSSGGGSDAGLF